jgi:hypothetical protein
MKFDPIGFFLLAARKLIATQKSIALVKEHIPPSTRLKITSLERQ